MYRRRRHRRRHSSGGRIRRRRRHGRRGRGILGDLLGKLGGILPF